MALRAISLCAGIGGIDLGLRLAGAARTICYVEREAYAAAVLAARIADGSLDEAPVWSGLSSFDGAPWRGAVDLVTAGFPCQPHSVAGQRKGLDDDRWIWPDIVHIIREVGPRLVFLENVPGLAASGGLAACLADLAALGFDAEWDVFSAEEVGAPHIRRRIFILAHAEGHAVRVEPERVEQRPPVGGYSEPRHARADLADADREREREPNEEASAERGNRARQDPKCGGADMADANDSWRLQPEGREPAERGRSGNSGEAVGYAVGARLEGWEGERGNDGEELAAAERTGGLCFPPTPSDIGGWDRWPGAEPAIRRGSDGIANRVDRLRACGNGVIPLVAAVAFETLVRRLGMG